MKKNILFVITLATLLLGTRIPLHAGTPEPHAYYVEVYEISLMGAKSVCINYGVNPPIGKSYKITDENEQPVNRAEGGYANRRIIAARPITN